jgi:hypothetical protein
MAKHSIPSVQSIGYIAIWLALSGLVPAGQTLVPVPSVTSNKTSGRQIAQEDLDFFAEVVKPSSPLSSEQISRLATTMRNDSVAVRLTAIESIVYRTQVASRQGKSTFATTRDLLASFKDIFVRLLKDDSEPRVRHEALLALGLLQTEPTVLQAIPNPSGVQDAQLAPGFIQTLADVYKTDQSALLRSEVMKTFALQRHETRSESLTIMTGVIREGLTDPSADVLMFAATGVATFQLGDVAPEVAYLLKHRDAKVRMAAAQAIGSFGKSPQASAYVQVLRNALIDEQDEITRRTLEAAIARLQQGK